MPAHTLSGTCLEQLVRIATPLLRAAQRQCPREGPGRLPDYEDWQVALLIVIAVLNRRKSKSAQYRFLHERRAALKPWLHLQDFPARSTYFLRYRQAHRLFQQAIGLQGAKALAEKVPEGTASVLGGWHGHAPLRDHVAVTRLASFRAHGHATARDHATRRERRHRN